MQRRHHRQRQHFAEQADDDERQRRAGGEPDHRADRGEHDHLREVDGEHVAAGGAERLEGGDHVAAAVDMALHRVGDADAADQQRGEADQSQELREAADGALELRRGVGAAADFPAGFAAAALRASSMNARRRRDRRRRCRAVLPDRSSAPGCRAAAGRWRAAPSSLIRKRGPKPTPPASLSGSASTTLRDLEGRARRQ